MKVLLRYLPFIGLLFVGIFIVQKGDFDLHRTELLLPEIIGATFILSSALAFRGLLLFHYLRAQGLRISLFRAVRAYNLSIMTKYIPGKIWPTLSVSLEIEQSAGNFGTAITYLIWFQIVMAISGISVSVVALSSFGEYNWCLGVLAFLGLFIVTVTVARIGLPKIVRRFLLGRFKVERCKFYIASTFLLHAFLWVLVSLAFWLFFRSLGYSIDIEVALLQPAANVAGFALPLSPGGLGAREAATAAYLHWALDELAAAIFLATAARMWFVMAEIIVFFSSLCIPDFDREV